MTYKIYHETLAEALVESGNAAMRAGATFTPAAFHEAVGAHVEPINYGCAASYSIQLLMLKGKTTRKYLQISLVRLDSGCYELTQYFL